MADIRVHDFHAHIYYDADEVERAKALAAEVQRRFGVPVGHFHLRAVGPHPRGRVQRTIPADRFGEVATFLRVATCRSFEGRLTAAAPPPMLKSMIAATLSPTSARRWWWRASLAAARWRGW